MNYEDFRLIKRLGRGGFGIIYLATNKKTNELVALKAYRENVDWENIEESLQLSMDLKHPNLMMCETFFYDRIVTGSNHFKKESSVHLFAVLEYIPGISLDNIIKHENIISKLNQYIPQIISGVKYLHSRKIIHRDIKVENILIDNDKVKIIDFDFLLDCSKNNLRSKMGTPFYLSPEIYLGEKYNEKTDNWSLGVTIYYCLTGNFPFDANNKLDLKRLVLSDFIPNYSGISDKYVQILKGLLTKNPIERMSLDEVLTIL